jgi:hypothetical protein
MSEFIQGLNGGLIIGMAAGCVGGWLYAMFTFKFARSDLLKSLEEDELLGEVKRRRFEQELKFKIEMDVD